ncbi:hypothetical protein [Cohnella rhizosphaerae]|uniref:Uncharacterized protein n=1 Tax=Cohnella rhizosphaerae TaxID=1457232 RepID=A0A9X4KX48_9BACL|nr:hypothetical protein [Cohnella rhizosphaerae]MDG0809844.1 hypothetical protein [Cohnella rhizosphaerae]
MKGGERADGLAPLERMMSAEAPSNLGEQKAVDRFDLFKGSGADQAVGQPAVDPEADPLHLQRIDGKSQLFDIFAGGRIFLAIAGGQPRLPR